MEPRSASPSAPRPSVPRPSASKWDLFARVAGRLRFYLRVYFLIAGQYLKARMQYRVDFLVSSVGILATNVLGVLLFWVLLSNIPSLAGWSFDELLFIYSFYLLAVSPAQIFFDNAWQLRYQVADGTFIKYYFRPLNMLFYFMSERVDVKSFAQVAFGIGAFVYSSSKLALVWGPARLVLLTMNLAGAGLAMIALLVLAASTAFWFVQSYPPLAFVWRVREFAPYPMNIYEGGFRFVFSCLIPIGFIAFYPAQVFLRPAEAGLLAYSSPLIGALLFTLAYRVWCRGVNHYSGTGS